MRSSCTISGIVASAFVAAMVACQADPTNLPPRNVSAHLGSAFIEAIKDLPLREREARITREVLTGNVPDFWRRFVPVAFTNTTSTATNIFGLEVAPDYLAIGSDADYFLAPLTPGAATEIARVIGCSLPTPRIVDAIHAAAPLKLTPTPIPPSPAMNTVPVFADHNSQVHTQRWRMTNNFPLGTLVAGHKKDVVLTSRSVTNQGKVAIYGWHYRDGTPVQPLYLGHADTWVDYSHGIRMVGEEIKVNGRALKLSAAHADPILGPILESTAPRKSLIDELADSAKQFGEINERIRLEPGVEVLVNRKIPPPGGRGHAPVHSILYALPNGSTIPQTIGRKTQEGDDWHFDIQHIGAQTRFLRNASPERDWVIAYLQSDEHAWPAWKKSHNDSKNRIAEIVTAMLKHIQPDSPSPDFSLNCHSGGGSFIFGYLDAMSELPDNLERIAFLDATYGFEPSAGHAAKIARWLKHKNEHALLVLAYEDYKGLLNGKTFVSEQGGTWHRSHLLASALESDFEIKFARNQNDLWHTWTGLDGRVVFLMRENPERSVWHTIMVERNGFIHSMLAGTVAENRGYKFFDGRAYSPWIAP